MIRSSLIALLLVFASLASVAPAADGVDPARVAPDNTWIYFEVHDMSALEAAWRETGLYKVWTDPQVQNFTKPARARMTPDEPPVGPDGAAAPERPEALQERFAQLSWDEFKDLFPGGLSVFISNVDVLPGGLMAFDLCIVGKAAKPREAYDRIARMIPDKPVPPDAELASFDIAGERMFVTRFKNKLDVSALPTNTAISEATMQRFNYTTLQVAMVDGWVMLCDGSKDTMPHMILRHKGRREDSLASASRFRSAMDVARPDSQFRMYLNIEGVAGALMKVVDANMNAASRRGGFDSPQMPVFNWSALSLGDFKSLGLAVDFGKAGIQSRAKLRVSDQPAGLGKVWNAMRGECRFKTARFAPEEVLGYSASYFDLGQFYKSLLEVVRGVSPMGGGFAEQWVATTRMKYGIDPVEDVINQIGGEFGQVVTRPTGEAVSAQGPPQVMIIECRDGKRLRETLAKLEKQLIQASAPQGGMAPESPFEKSRYLGYEIWTVKMQDRPGAMMPMGEPPAWCVTDSWIVLSSSDEKLKETLGRIDGREKRSFADTKEFQSARARFEGKLSSLSYADTAEHVTAALEQLQQMSGMLMLLSRGKFNPNFLDFASMPDRAVFEQHLGPTISADIVKPDGSVLIWSLEPPK